MNETQLIQTIILNGNDYERSFAQSIYKILNINNLGVLTEKQKAYWEKLKAKYDSKPEIQAKIADDDFSPMVFNDKAKEKMQREAYAKWEQNNCRGTITAATGSGKSQIGIMAIRKHFTGSNRIVIVVPQIAIMNQWVSEILAQLGNWCADGKTPTSAKIGRLGGGFTEEKPIMVCVVNSLWQIPQLKADLVIWDEMHHYGAELSFDLFQKAIAQKVLGLTATIEREDEMHTALANIAPVVYNYTQEKAIDAGVLVGFELINVPVSLTPDERIKLDGCDSVVKEYMPYFNNDYNYAIETLTDSRESGETKKMASYLLQAIGVRKQILMHAFNKIGKTVEIVVAEGIPKTIIFCGFIDTVNDLSDAFKVKGYDVAKYHSGMKSKEKAEMLQGFRDDKYKVMISAKCLDEGVNIPNAELAIIVGGSKVERQMIQRLGRVLRTAPGKTSAKVYQLYIPHTQDQSWLVKRSKELSKAASNVRWL